MKERPENLRTEYSALTSYYETVITFRFTTVGFFLAATGLIVQSGMTYDKTILLLVLTLGAWIVEIRNRTIFSAILDRATQIEEDWDFQGGDQFTPLFRRMIRIGLWKKIKKKKQKSKDPRPMISKFPWSKIKFFVLSLPCPEEVLTHSLWLDLIYGGVLLFTIRKTWQLHVCWVATRKVSLTKCQTVWKLLSIFLIFELF